MCSIDQVFRLKPVRPVHVGLGLHSNINKDLVGPLALLGLALSLSGFFCLICVGVVVSLCPLVGFLGGFSFWLVLLLGGLGDFWPPSWFIYGSCFTKVI